MKHRLTILLFLLTPVFVFAQNKAAKDSLTTAAKPMTSLDSVMVKQIFYSALREKTIENFTLAAEQFNRVLQIDHSNTAAMYELANLKKLKGGYADAQSLMERAVMLSPNNEWYWLSLADCYEKSNNIPKLEIAFTQLIRLNPDKADYYFDKANALFIEKKYDEALSIYGRIEKLTGLTDDILAGRQKIYLKQGKVDQAAAEIQEMITANPTQVRYVLLLAEIYNSNGLNDKALKALDAAEKTFPSNGQLHLALADIYRDKKNYQACFDELKLAFAVTDLNIESKIKILAGYLPKFPDPDAEASATELSRIITVAHPADARAYATYGDILFQTGKYKEAKVAYKKAIQLNGNNYIVWEQLVRIELSDNDKEGALKDGQYALTLYPNQAWMNYLVGVAYVQSKDYKKGISYIKNAADLETEDKTLLSVCYASLGDCYHELQDSKSSDAAYDQSLSYNPDNAYALNNYAYYLSLRNERLDKAATMSNHSNELQPNTASFEDTYAWILFKQKNYTDAKLWIEKAILHDKTNSAVQIEHYGDIMFYLGNTDAAVQNWKKAKSYGEQSPVLDRKINERKYIE